MKIVRTLHLPSAVAGCSCCDEVRLAILRDDEGKEWSAPLRWNGERWVFRMIDLIPYREKREAA